MTANVFDIQRGSLVDGSGVRTTVFFKGCNLRCRWCHNPESRNPARQMLFYRGRCAGCGACREACPHGAVREDFTVDPRLCALCGMCCEVCHPEAKTTCGEEVEVGEILAKIRRDESFYRDSGGGVTVSGGECMLQPEPLRELLNLCRGAGIGTAVDTAGNVPFEYFREILPLTDLFLYDLKHTDSATHKAGTGVGNELILENLERLLDECPGKVIIRVPLVPGFNADEESARSISRWISSHPAPRAVEPLKYHAMGAAKSEALGEEYPAIDPLPAEEFSRYKQILTEAVLR